jgi:cyclopropane fatty-acyl-phospholipid synthase-like methyltransferase
VHWVDELLLEELATLGEAKHVLDLGCGLGASLIYLAHRANVRGTGITLSSVQARRARELIAEANLGSSLVCLHGDFHELDPALSNVDLAFAIESFVLSPDASRFFEQCRRAVRHGGRLVICDDFLTDDRELTKVERSQVRRFRHGWRVDSLLSVAQAAALASRNGFRLRRELDLTPHLELRRPRDLVIKAVVKALGWLDEEFEYLASLRGGDALQDALGSRAITYRVLVFEREPTPAIKAAPTA